MAAALSLYPRPKTLRPCLDALNEFWEGRIDRAELDRRTREMEAKRLPLFNHRGTETQRNLEKEVV